MKIRVILATNKDLAKQAPSCLDDTDATRKSQLESELLIWTIFANIWYDWLLERPEAAEAARAAKGDRPSGDYGDYQDKQYDAARTIDLKMIQKTMSSQAELNEPTDEEFQKVFGNTCLCACIT